jgi:hypothetical protein
MITEKIKKTFFNKLTKDLSDCDIICHNKSIWFIDENKKYWYIELDSNNELWWRYEYFNILISLFQFTEKEFNDLLIEWLEDILHYNIKPSLIGGAVINDNIDLYVKNSSYSDRGNSVPVENILKYKILKFKK